MQFYIDQSGAPLARLANSYEYIQVIPFTIYQLEKLKNQNIPLINNLIEIRCQTLPNELTKENIMSAFLTGVTFQEALMISSCYKLKMPTTDQIEDAHNYIFTEPNIYKNTLDFLAKNNSSKNKKVEEIIEILSINFASRAKINFTIAEFASSYAQKPYGNIYTYKNNCLRELLAIDKENVKCEDFGFSCIFV